MKHGDALTKGLSSHSFRRGAAQNANGSSNISTPWILDRGGWSMTAVSKAFNYIVSTTHEDQQVGKRLAGWDAKAKFKLPNLQCFDVVVLQRIKTLQSLLFACAQGFSGAFSLRDGVVEVLMAVALLHFHDVLLIAANSPYIKRVHQAMSQLQINNTEVAAWAVTIQQSLLQRGTDTGGVDEAKPPQSEHKISSIDEILKKQAVLIDQQTQLITSLAAE